MGVVQLWVSPFVHNRAEDGCHANGCHANAPGPLCRNASSRGLPRTTGPGSRVREGARCGVRCPALSDDVSAASPEGAGPRHARTRAVPVIAQETTSGPNRNVRSVKFVRAEAAMAAQEQNRAPARPQPHERRRNHARVSNKRHWRAVGVPWLRGLRAMTTRLPWGSTWVDVGTPAVEAPRPMPRAHPQTTTSGPEVAWKTAAQ